MKVVAFNGSARKDGNTAILIEKIFDQLKAEGIECEMVQLAGSKIQGCIACYKCFERKDKKCAVTADHANDYIAKCLEADGIILGSPTYFANVSAGMKALMERVGMVGRANEFMLKRKVGAAAIAVRRAGATSVLGAINAFFLAEQMIVPGSSYWNLGVGRDIGQVHGDEEGMKTMADLGANMAWLLKKIKA